jgi:hypothetical protein
LWPIRFSSSRLRSGNWKSSRVKRRSDCLRRLRLSGTILFLWDAKRWPPCLTRGGFGPAIIELFIRSIVESCLCLCSRLGIGGKSIAEHEPLRLTRTIHRQSPLDAAGFSGSYRMLQLSRECGSANRTPSWLSPRIPESTQVSCLRLATRYSTLYSAFHVSSLPHFV